MEQDIFDRIAGIDAKKPPKVGRRFDIFDSIQSELAEPSTPTASGKVSIPLARPQAKVPSPIVSAAGAEGRVAPAAPATPLAAPDLRSARLAGGQPAGPPLFESELKSAWDWSGESLVKLRDFVDSVITEARQTPATVAGPRGLGMRQEIPPGKVEAGIEKGLASTLEAFTSPRNIALMFALPLAAGEAILGRIIQGTLSAQMVYEGIKSFPGIAETFRSGDIEGGIEALTATAAASALAGYLGKQAISPKKLPSAKPAEVPPVEVKPAEVPPVEVKPDVFARVSEPAEPSAKTATEFSEVVTAIKETEVPPVEVTPELRSVVDNAVDMRLKEIEKPITKKPPETPRFSSYDDAQKGVDAYENTLAAKYGEDSLFIFDKKKEPFTPEESAQREALYEARDAFDRADVETFVEEASKRFEPLIPDKAERTKFVRKITEADLPTALRSRPDKWTVVGDLANEIVWYLSKKMEDIPQTAFNIRALLAGTADDPKIQLKMTSEAGLGPSRAVLNEAQRWMDHLYWGEEVPQIPGATPRAPKAKPMPVEQFAKEAGAAQAAQRATVLAEVQQNVLDAADSRVSKRDLLGPEKKKTAAPAPEPGLFGEAPAPETPSLFGSAGGYVSARTPPTPLAPASPGAQKNVPQPKPLPTSPGASGEVLSRFEEVLAETPKPTVWQKIKSLGKTVPKEAQRRLVSEYTPWRDVERVINEGAGEKVRGPGGVDVARELELVAGAQGKAEADLIEFRQAVSDPIKENWKDFDLYLLMKRTASRLVNDPEVKKVGDFTVEETAQGLAELQARVGDPVFAQLEKSGEGLQAAMNQALKLQVTSGRMSQEVYDKIVAENDFYAKFAVLKYASDDVGFGAGTGRSIATTADYTKAITGIEQEILHLGSPLQASAEQLIRSRILAEKNLAMLELDKLEGFGDVVKRARPTRHYQVSYKPAEDILQQLGLQQTAKNPQLLEQSFVKVGKAIEFADEVGLKLKFKDLPSSLGRATIGGVETGGRVSLKAFTSEVVAHELGHSFDTIVRDMQGRPITKTKKVFGVDKEVTQRLSSAINVRKGMKFGGGATEFQKELSAVQAFTGQGGTPKYKAKAVERFAEYLQLYIHDPKKARELAPTWTDHFETRILPKEQVKKLVEKLSAFYQKVDGLPNIMTQLKGMDSNYLELAIRRAFPDRKPITATIFGTKPQPGNDIINYYKDGVETALEVPKALADAVKGLNAKVTGLIATALRFTRTPLQWGATGANAAFQVVNKFRDTLRLTVLSRYGIRADARELSFPMDWSRALLSSFKGNFGHPDSAYIDYLKSGAANSVIQSGLTPEAFKPTLGLPEASGRIKSVGQSILKNVASFGKAMEESTKLLTLKRGKMFENFDQLSEKAQITKLKEIAVEGRNYGGSPDFFRRGADTVEFNLIAMFFNPRVQGPASDLARLAGKTEGGGAAAWARLATIVGLPATFLAAVNLQEEYKKDYDKLTKWERESYFMIPRNKFFINDSGERVRDYWRVPKGETMGVFANLIEGAIQFAYTLDPTQLTDMATGLLENVSPINIQGKTWQERGESAISSLNPLIKTPVELATGRDVFRKQNTIPDYMAKASPTEQYRNTTPKEFVAAAKALKTLTGVEVSPLQIQQATQGITGGAITQFTMGKPQAGREPWTVWPIIKRFVRSPSVEGEEMQADITAASRAEGDKSVARRREALDLLSNWKESGISKADRAKEIARVNKVDPKLAEKLRAMAKESDLGVSYVDKQIAALGVESGARAMFIVQQLGKLKSDDERNQLLASLRKKGILTPKVQAQVTKLRRKPS